MKKKIVNIYVGYGIICGEGLKKSIDKETDRMIKEYINNNSKNEKSSI